MSTVSSIPVSSPTGSAADSPGLDAGVPWHFGEPLREQRALAEGAAIIDRSNRGVLVIPGSDRLSWLHSICSQHVSQLRDGESTQTLILSPNGHVEQHWQITELGEQLWLDVEPGMNGEALEYLEKMRFMKRVEPTDVSDSYGVLTIIGPNAAVVLAGSGLPLPVTVAAVPVTPADSKTAPSSKMNPVPDVVGPTTDARPLPEGGFIRQVAEGRYDVIVPLVHRAETIDALLSAGGERAGSWALEAWRVEHRQPRLRFDTDHRTLAHEVGWIGSAVHLDKGCYRGQETVARVQNLGRPPRRLVLLHLSGESDTLPPPGTPVELAGRSVGFLGTAAQHYELGPIALAVVKRSTPDESELNVGGFAAAIDH
ncbi:hypothetical protein SAMN05892883_0381 [Jatrophihabitans sp. GAS493]|uniref:CAF17-like 4Fe-4S cluster assembly/insertion protein YgfZ n=1 Tax=Jatrophihabitans sp. GAS493 TaxID=1907575 RepID=UPI000BC0A58D|nr:folate-binding protein YgfZ [Jatrophihabitans sp. GAS493]SOD70727.1 hypothetical protein SAMN05892883_0381 [Jatrophihabitans sp. GAS493]